MRFYKADGFVRIAKRNAEHRYNNGEVIYLCPFKLRPGEPYHPEIAITKTDFSEKCWSEHVVPNTRDFEKVVDDFTFYNCNYSVGHYPAYYIKEEQDK